MVAALVSVLVTTLAIEVVISARLSLTAEMASPMTTSVTWPDLDGGDSVDHVGQTDLTRGAHDRVQRRVEGEMPTRCPRCSTCWSR